MITVFYDTSFTVADMDKGGSVLDGKTGLQGGLGLAAPGRLAGSSDGIPGASHLVAHIVWPWAGTPGFLSSTC